MHYTLFLVWTKLTKCVLLPHPWGKSSCCMGVKIRIFTIWFLKWMFTSVNSYKTWFKCHAQYWILYCILAAYVSLLWLYKFISLYSAMNVLFAKFKNEELFRLSGNRPKIGRKIGRNRPMGRCCILKKKYLVQHKPNWHICIVDFLF